MLLSLVLLPPVLLSAMLQPPLLLSPMLLSLVSLPPVYTRLFPPRLLVLSSRRALAVSSPNDERARVVGDVELR